MTEIRVQIFGYGSPTDHKMAFRSWSGGPFEYNNLKIVDDNTYTHVVLYYSADAPAMPNIKHIPKDNVIAFLHEPFELLNINWDFIRDNVGTCVVHDKTRVPQLPCIKEYISYLAPGVPITELHKFSTEKRYLMSIVASMKGHLEGHQLRHQLIQLILSSDMNIHIWGRGTNVLYRDPRVKGSTEAKHEMFAPYVFSIAIENTKCPWWVSEKYYDPILCNTIPLYWGADRVSDVFGQLSHITLPRDINGAFYIIKDVYTNPGKYQRNVLDVKNKLLNENNYKHFLWRHFNHDRLI